MISRRKLITTGAIAGAVTLLSPAVMKATASGQISGSQSGDVGDFIAVLKPSDPTFVSTLNKLFPGLLQDPIFQKIQSHAVLTSNISDAVISAYSTRWKVTTATGGYETILKHYAHPSTRRPRTSHFGVKGNKTRFTGKIPALKPGMTRLVTPYFNWSPGYYQAHQKPKWQTILLATASRQFSLVEWSNASNIQVSIDAVILNHSTLVGADQGKLGRMFRVSRNAEHDEANSILKLVASGASSDQAGALLQEHASGPLPSRSDGLYLYEAVRRRQAKVLLRRFKYATPAQFLRTLKYLKRQRKTTVGLITTA